MDISKRFSFLKKVFGANSGFSADGINFNTICPHCEKLGKNSAIAGKRKLSINIENQLNQCWVCGHHSNSIYQFIPSYLKKEYSEIFGKNKKENGHTTEIEKRKASLPADFKLLALHQDSKLPDVKRALKYLQSRQISKSDLWRYKFGISEEYEIKNRVIVPSFNSTGFLNFYSARAIEQNNRIKYIHSDIHKNEIIFNEINVSFSRPLVLTEGPFDLISINRFYNSTCLLGSMVSNNQYLFQQIVKNNTPIILCLDNDALEKQDSIAEFFFSYGIDVCIAKVPSQYHDLGEMVNKQEQICSAIDNCKPWSWEMSIYTKLNELNI